MTYAVTRVADLYPASIGQRIAAERAKARRTVFDVHAETGITPTRLARIETGQVTVKADEAVAIAWAIGCPVSAILGSDVRRHGVVSHHGEPDMAVVEQLVEYLELAAFLDDMGIPDPRGKA